MTTPAPTVVKTITEAEIRDMTHYCHFIAARQGKRSVVMYRFAECTPCELLTTLLAARSQTRQPLLRIRTTREPVARQLPQRRYTGSGDGEEEVSITGERSPSAPSHYCPKHG